MRPTLILAWVFLLAGPAIAENVNSSAGRFQIAPDRDGFVRLDTMTGAVSHCHKREGTWRCDALAEERTDLDRDISLLRQEVAVLRAELSRLTGRLGATAQDSVSTSAELQIPGGRQIDQPEKSRSFVEQVMYRFLEMVRQLKSEKSVPQS